MRTVDHKLRTLTLGACLLVTAHPAVMAADSVLPADRDVPLEAAVPRADTRYDHVIAWVPAAAAPTAGVAQAVVHVALNRAARAAEAELCNGTWTLNQPVTQTVEPRPVRAPASLGGEVAWYYRISRDNREVMSDCPGVTKYAFQQQVSRHLPEWMMIRPAYQVSLLQQGHKIHLGGSEDPGEHRTLAMNGGEPRRAPR